MEQNENTLSVLKIAPGQYPQQVEIDNDLKALQQAVGGSIGASYPFEDPVAIVYNDDGKLMGLPLNRALWDEDGLMYDVIAGTFLVVGLGEEDFVSLSPELAQKYEAADSLAAFVRQRTGFEGALFERDSLRDFAAHVLLTASASLVPAAALQKLSNHIAPAYAPY